MPKGRRPPPHPDVIARAKRIRLADLLGPLRYLGRCTHCDRQFLSVNEYVYVATNGAKICNRCAHA